jgi:soluble lytic murein transglycosylase
VYLQRTEPPWYARLWYPLRYSTNVRVYGSQDHLDAALLAAVIEAESKFNADARSSAGAVGLMQLTPSTAKGIARYTGGSRFRVSDLTNPDINIRYGAWYLGHLLNKYGNERLALAAYNAGQANVDRWQQEHVGIQFRETRDYVDKVERL